MFSCTDFRWEIWQDGTRCNENSRDDLGDCFTGNEHEISDKTGGISIESQGRHIFVLMGFIHRELNFNSNVLKSWINPIYNALKNQDRFSKVFSKHSLYI